jgi:hypothetical protein
MHGAGFGPTLAWLLAAAVVLAGGALLWLWGAAPGPEAQPAPAAGPAERPAPAPAAAAAPAVPASLPPTAAPVPAPPSGAPMFTAARPVRDPNGDQTPDLADYVNPGEKPTMAEVISRLQAAGVTSGLGAFQPPGTRPPLIGLAVPEDFVLPEGYVRHHQATDDGQRIEAILMFSPDHRWVDAAGRPVALPADRVVPPEWAPPGLPIRRIVVPAPIDGTR